MYETSCWQPPGCWPTSVRGGMIADKDNAIQPVLKCLTHRKVPLHELTPRSEGGTSCFPVARRRNRVALKMATLRDPSLGSSCRFYIDTQFIGVWHARVDPRVSELLAPHQPAALARTSGEKRVASGEKQLSFFPQAIHTIRPHIIRPRLRFLKLRSLVLDLSGGSVFLG